MAKDKPNTKPEADKEINDDSDAFARANTGASAPADQPPPSTGKASKAKASTGRARTPDVVVDDKIDLEDMMSPEDAARQIVMLTDRAFDAVTMLREYDKYVLPSGEKILDMTKPQQQDKDALVKALARLMRNGGVKISPGWAFGFAFFGCYGAPILSLEMTIAVTKKAQKASS